MPFLQTLATGPVFPASYQDLPHVLLIVDGFPKALGGGERVVLRLAELLPRYGYRASILTFVRHPGSAFKLEQAPCPVYLLPLTNTYGPSAFRGALALRGLLRTQRVEVVQTFFESSDLWAGLVVRLLSSAKLIWNRRDMGILRGRKHQLAYRAMRRIPHAVAAVSHRVAEHVIQVDGVSADRVFVIHNGLDLAFAPPRPAWRSANRDPLITTIGNVRRVKGHDVLLEAAARVVQVLPSARFTIAGEVLDPEFHAVLVAQIETLGLTQHVSFLGSVSDLTTHLRASDLFVLPSRSEGFSNALVEAMAAGLPCIATDVGGNAEALEHGESGLIVRSEDSAALAEGLLLLLQDEEQAARLSVAAREAAATHFSAEAMMRKVTRLMEHVRKA